MNAIGAEPNDWDKHFILVNDVNLAQYTGTQFNIIGIDPYLGTPFTGVFDGNDHKIWNFTWSSTGRNNIGLFGSVDRPGLVKNLGIENVDVNAVNGWHVGGLVGVNQGTITNCYSTGSVSGGWYVGGLVGNNGGNITNCYSTGSVSGDENVGGLVGATWYGSVTQSYSSGVVSGGLYVGGLVGFNENLISDSYSTGTVNGNDCVGGLVGMNDSEGTIANCYSVGAVHGDYAVGGLVGWNPVYCDDSG